MQKSREAIIAASFFGEKNNMMWFVLKGARERAAMAKGLAEQDGSTENLYMLYLTEFEVRHGRFAAGG